MPIRPQGEMSDDGRTHQVKQLSSSFSYFLPILGRVKDSAGSKEGRGREGTTMRGDKQQSPTDGRLQSEADHMEDELQFQ